MLSLMDRTVYLTCVLGGNHVELNLRAILRSWLVGWCSSAE